MTDTLTKTAAANASINDTRKAELLSKEVKQLTNDFFREV